jgi:hypothetical protein
VRRASAGFPSARLAVIVAVVAALDHDYNQWRPHFSLHEDAPIPRPAPARSSRSEVGALHHHDERRAT